MEQLCVKLVLHVHQVHGYHLCVQAQVIQHVVPVKILEIVQLLLHALVQVIVYVLLVYPVIII